MSRYLVCEWEDNGYHDSYFFAAYFDGKELKSEEIGSTAYGGGGSHDASTSPLHTAPAKIKAAFRKLCIETAVKLVIDGDIKFINEPESIKKGETLITVRDCKKKNEPTVPAGVKGEVFWFGSFGTFYRNGWNKPNRKNTRVGLLLANGEKVFVPLAACKRDLEPKTAASVHKNMSKSYDDGTFNYLPLTRCKAWLSACFVNPPKPRQ